MKIRLLQQKLTSIFSFINRYFSLLAWLRIQVTPRVLAQTWPRGLQAPTRIVSTNLATSIVSRQLLKGSFEKLFEASCALVHLSEGQHTCTRTPAYIYIYMYTHLSLYLSLSLSLYIYIYDRCMYAHTKHIHTHKHTHTHMHAYKQTHTHIRARAHIHAYTHTRIHTYTYTHTHIYTYTHTHIHT